MIYVVDASVAVKWFVFEGDHKMAQALVAIDVALTAPDLIFAELANVLRRKVRGGLVTEDQAREALETMQTTFSAAVRSSDLLQRAFELSAMLDHSVYDCLYLACADQAEDRILVTADDKFVAKAVSAGHGHKIITLSDAVAGIAAGQEH
ncbi:hypothetical protein BJF92_20460 [Rhizobium rhizosphaerae]|uniref:PIN domain-containing protein n=1 Tax=Xaviernesmea rhizosphaerae TaxID=1672749 RepID=A0A1Q9ALG0_9HYPH|nr:type II toxin-antitoxin system VapC family toxin [Xaviernesmea rhizosphaerae]OLP56168.1 hypothetical protein BJF92_20460 [Xaviernesmea rhizosphaerae]